MLQYKTSPEMNDKNELKNGRTPEHTLSAEEKRKSVVEFNSHYDDHIEVKKALEELEKAPSFQLSKEIIALLILHVFNDLISYLASRSVERIASYAEYLVKELPSRSRLFCLGVPKFEDTVAFSKIPEEEETEKLITFFLCRHPLTNDINRLIHSFQDALQETVNSCDKKSPVSRREASIELPSTSMLLSSTSHVLSTTQHKRSFQIAFPTSPNWMLTPCKEGSATFFVDEPASRDHMTSCNHVKNILMLPSPRIRGTPGFYSLCRRFGTMHETSLDRVLPETEDRNTKERSASSIAVVRNCSFSNDHFNTKENFEKQNYDSSSTNEVLEKEDMSPHLSTCREKNTSSSWSILNPSLGRVQNLIKHIESKSPLASIQKNSLMNTRSNQNQNDIVDESLNICSTPENHMMQTKATCLEKDTSTKPDYDSHSLGLQTNPPETFGATPIPVRKSASTNIQYITETKSSPQQDYTLLDVQTPPSQKKISLSHSVSADSSNSKGTSKKLHDIRLLDDPKNTIEEEEEERHIMKEALDYSQKAPFERQIDQLQETITVQAATQLKLHGKAEAEKENLPTNQYLSKTTYKRATSHDYGNFNRRYDFPSSMSFGKPQDVNRDLIGLVYPQSKDEAEKVAKEAPSQILSVKCHEPYKFLPPEKCQQVCNNQNVSEKQSCNKEKYVSPLQSVYEKPVIKKDGCTSLCNVKGNTSAVTQQQDTLHVKDSRIYHYSQKCNSTVSSPLIFNNDENKRLTPRFRTCERRMHRTLKKIQCKDFNDQADLSGEEDNHQVRKTGKKEASWAKNPDEWFLLVKNQLDIDPLSIFGCGVRPVLFEDIFQTPDFYRAAKDIEKNERLCQRAPDLLCQEGRYKQARKWYQDEQLCGFRKTDGVSKEAIAKFRNRVGRLKDVSSLVWDSHWTLCDSSCVHNSSLRQPWFCKMATYGSPILNSSLRRTASHLNSETKKHKSPLPLNQTNLSIVHEEPDEFLDDNLGCTTPEGYTRGIFCTTGPLTATRLLKLSGANRAPESFKKNITKENNNRKKDKSGISPKSFKTQEHTIPKKKLNQSDYLPSLGGCPDFRFRSKNTTKLHLTRSSPTQVKNSGLSLFSKFRDKL